MPFQAGHSKLGGRSPGVPNKKPTPTVSQQLKQQLEDALSSGGHNVVTVWLAEWQRLDDRLAKVETFLHFMEFVYPKQRQLQMDVSLEDAVRIVEDAIVSTGETPLAIGPAEEDSDESV